MEMGELNGERIRQAGRDFLQNFRESWRLRAAVCVTLAVCAVVALFVWADGVDGREQIALSAGSMDRNGAGQQAKVLAIRGSDNVLVRENLRNPFLPEHPDERQQRAMRDTQAAAGIQGGHHLTPGRRGSRAESGGKAFEESTAAGRASAGAVKQVAGDGSLAGGVNGIGGRQERTLQLQGIIRTGEGAGAILLIGSDTRLLLAGETLKGCVLEAVGQDEAVVMAGGSKRRLQIGEKVFVQA